MVAGWMQKLEVCVYRSIKQQDVVPNLAGNGFVVIGQSTSRMRVSEFAELLELIQAFGTERGVKVVRRSATGSRMESAMGRIGLHDYQIKYASTTRTAGKRRWL